MTTDDHDEAGRQPAKITADDSRETAAPRQLEHDEAGRQPAEVTADDSRETAAPRQVEHEAPALPGRAATTRCYSAFDALTLPDATGQRAIVVPPSPRSPWALRFPPRYVADRDRGDEDDADDAEPPWTYVALSALACAKTQEPLSR